MATATLIAIGNEILIGRTLDTNTHWLAQRLREIGVGVEQIITIADKEGAIRDALDWAFTKSDIVISCGGLGGTIDDVTRKTLARYFETELAPHEPTLERLKKIYAERGRTFTDATARIALVPRGCQVLPNEQGLAPALLFEKGTEKRYFVLPGVPHEMKYLAQQYIFPYLQTHFTSQIFHAVTLRTMGATESHLATLLAPFEEKLPPYIELAYNPSFSSLDIRLSLAIAKEEEAKGRERFNELLQDLKTYLKPFLFGEGEARLEEVLGQLLIAQRATLSIAESCTGGALCAKIISVPGASAYIQGGVVAYANEEKIKTLGVRSITLEQFGAVSEEVAIEMACGIRNKMNTSIGLSTTGIAGPDGGTPSKPVGLVWIGYTDPFGSFAKRFIFENNRERVVERAVANALYIAIKKIRENQLIV
jgi:nicotinamide-nucleotide amidase